MGEAERRVGTGEQAQWIERGVDECLGPLIDGSASTSYWDLFLANSKWLQALPPRLEMNKYS